MKLSTILTTTALLLTTATSTIAQTAPLVAPQISHNFGNETVNELNLDIAQGMMDSVNRRQASPGAGFNAGEYSILNSLLHDVRLECYRKGNTQECKDAYRAFESAKVDYMNDYVLNPSRWY